MMIDLVSYLVYQSLFVPHCLLFQFVEGKGPSLQKRNQHGGGRECGGREVNVVEGNVTAEGRKGTSQRKGTGKDQDEEGRKGTGKDHDGREGKGVNPV